MMNAAVNLGLNDEERTEDVPESPAPVGNLVQPQRRASPGGGLTDSTQEEQSVVPFSAMM